MQLSTLAAAAAAILLISVTPSVSACASHDNYLPVDHPRRRSTTHAKRSTEGKDWAYEASYNWGMINENYTLCQTGTQQSPIALQLNGGLSLNHAPIFDYPSTVAGTFYNWGYGPAFTITRESADNYTTLPQLRFDDTTVYLTGWHIHAPADHTVGGDRSKAELHLVHADESGQNRAVLAFRLDPGSHNSTFFDQLPQPFIGFHNATSTTGADEVELELDLTLALQNVGYFNEFWTYMGSLTSPPCTEGVRWFVARQILFTSVDQMRMILGASTYSARAEQEVWLHGINV